VGSLEIVFNAPLGGALVEHLTSRTGKDTKRVRRFAQPTSSNILPLMKKVPGKELFLARSQSKS
jgi:hypothetical protein